MGIHRDLPPNLRKRPSSRSGIVAMACQRWRPVWASLRTACINGSRRFFLTRMSSRKKPCSKQRVEILRLRAQVRRVQEERDAKKRRAVLCQGTRTKYVFMTSIDVHAITLMCRVLRIARVGFYEWIRQSVSDRAKEDARLLDLVRHSYAASHGVYGARRVFGDLREVGESCGLHCVDRLLRCHKIKAVRGYKAPRAIAGHPFHPFAKPPAACVNGGCAQ